jgi:DNA-binding NarL/FixJ family response regulator
MSPESRRQLTGASSAATAADRRVGDETRHSDAPGGRRPRIIVADDHRAMLDTLVRLLSAEFEIVAAVGDGEAAVEQVAHHQPDVVVLDIAMPRVDGIAAAARLKAGGSAAKVVFVTNLHHREFVQRALALGEVGFVVKDRLVADLLPAIRGVLAGETFVSPSVGGEPNGANRHGASE